MYQQRTAVEHAGVGRVFGIFVEIRERPYALGARVNRTLHLAVIEGTLLIGMRVYNYRSSQSRWRPNRKEPPPLCSCCTSLMPRNPALGRTSMQHLSILPACTHARRKGDNGMRSFETDR